LDNGNLVLNQSGSVSITNNMTGTGNFVQAGSGVNSLSGVNSYTGQTLVTGGSLMVDGSVGGLPTSVLTNAPGTVVGGNGSVLGVFNADGIINPGDPGSIGTFTAADGLTVYPSGSLTFDLNSGNNTEGSGINDLLQVTGDLTVNNTTIAVNIQGGLPQLGTTYPVVAYSGALHGSFNSVVKSHFAATVDTSTANLVNVIITGTNGATLKWNSTGSGIWDLGSTANWFNFGTSSTDVFGQGDSVLFDDSVAGVQTTIVIPSGVAVYPSAITNISTANSYTIGGGGTIGGPAALVKDGTNTLTISTTNSFTGGVTILNGIFKAGSGTALGLNNTATITNIVANGATIDENGQNLGSATFMVSGAGFGGNGAIINSGPDQGGNDAFQNIVLAGDTTFGGPGNAAGGGNTAGRWDMRGGTPTLTCLNGNAYNLTKVGSNQVTLVGVTVDPNLANILVKGGVFGVQGGVTSLGNSTNVLALYNTGTLLHCAGFSTALNKVIVMTNASVDCTGTGANEFDGPVSMYGTNTFNLTDALTFTGGFGGPGGFTKSGAGALTLTTGTNTYTGNTVISAGTLMLSEPAALTNSANISFAVGTTIDVNSRNDQSLSLNSGQTLGGGGNINGSLTNNSGASYFVGGNRLIGTNVISNVATLLGTTYMDVTNNGARYDVIQASSIVLGGALVVSNLDLAHPFTAGQSFQLFSGSCSGAFANIVPPTPGPGLGWDTNSLVSSGTLNIVSTVVPQPVFASIVLSGTNLVFSGTNGSINGTFSVLTSTNLTLPLGQWITNASSQFDGSGNFSVTNSINPGTPQQFFLLKTP
jgi:fibronectin-binding autotransporter adhesin